MVALILGDSRCVAHQETRLPVLPIGVHGVQLILHCGSLRCQSVDPPYISAEVLGGSDLNGPLGHRCIQSRLRLLVLDEVVEKAESGLRGGRRRVDSSFLMIDTLGDQGSYLVLGRILEVVE